MFKEEESIEKRDIKIPRAQHLPGLLLKEPKKTNLAPREKIWRDVDLVAEIVV